MVLEFVGDSQHHDLSDPLTGVSLFALVGGVVIYLVGHVAFKWRTQHDLYWPRLIAAAVLVALSPLLGLMPALAALAVVTLVPVALVAFETVHHAELRAQIRHEGHQHT
jgi:low temperature requirement protein LtrA